LGLTSWKKTEIDPTTKTERKERSPAKKRSGKWAGEERRGSKTSGGWIFSENGQKCAYLGIISGENPLEKRNKNENHFEKSRGRGGSDDF